MKLYFIAVHNNTIKQCLEIAAIWASCVSGTIMLQITVKYLILPSQ